ncbi:glycosyl transferase family 90-domain-containing protein [Mycena albidolilacea]|uniref:Glycosyl transferase family 90-domain-containing protein n=1 Tax=Mycena albidolilacea TaxID=1033008 RepID=A0AAD7ARP3_9AGAR|nr:glycosyl transferase family 90-domain-containing protein [Mycena albidolilacea]
MFQLKRLVGQVAGPSYARVPQSNETSSPLLPTHQKDEDDEPPFTPNGTSSRSFRPRSLCRRILVPTLFILALFAGIATVAYFMGSPNADPAATPAPPIIPPEDHDTSLPPADNGHSNPSPPADHPATDADPAAAARVGLTALFARQSQTLAQAAARYSLKNDRPPPPNFDKWFKLAQDKKCLIDDYDQIQRDFEPFYQLAEENPAHFADMIDRGRAMMLKDPKGMTTINIKGGKVHMPDYRGTSFYDDWPRTIGRFVSVLPDMDFLLNGRDEPRVVFNFRDPDARKDAMVLKDPNPFHIAPRPTSQWFADKSGCSPLSSPKGFPTNGSADIAFLRSSSSSDFTTDLWPLLSMTKISPCFSDILFPGQYYYDESWWSGSFSHPNDIDWKDKTPKLYWRGMSNGGHILGQNYHKFPRFRLVDIARNHSDLIDAKMTRFAESHCTDDCDRDGIIKEYDITGPQSPKEEVYKYKYLLDVDGNTFSGRYLGLLRSGSLVFKSTVFDEYFNDWIRPYEHYVPVLPDLSDVVEKVQWAIENEAEARRIQAAGQLVAERVMTDSQNDCYFAMVLLEWARLQSYKAHPPPPKHGA